MKLNNKGFTLIEIMAVLVISSIILIPLMTTLTGSINISQRSQMRRITSSVAVDALYGIEKIDFSEFRILLDTANGTSDYYIDVDSTVCNNLTDPDAQTVCNSVLSTVWNNLSFTDAQFNIYMFDYVLTTTQWNALIANQSIDDLARNEIQNNPDILNNINNNPANKIDTLIRVIIWFDYFDEPDQYYVLTGVIADE